MTYQVMPDLTAEEYAELKADIAARGVMVPIEFDEHGNTLDGHHRLKICAELGIKDYPKVIRAGMTETEKRTHARKLNMARRQLNREQKQQLIQAQLRETPERSDRQIAAGLGVDKNTVNVQRKKMESTGEIHQLKTSVGADGKERPRQVERKPTLLPPSTMWEAESQERARIGLEEQVQARKPVSVFNPTPREERAVQRPEIVERMAAKGETATEAQRGIKADIQESRREQNAEKVSKLSSPLEAQGLFQTIVIDPPWDWGDEGDVNQFGRAKPEYSTMPIEEIEKMPISKIADDNCHLYLWVTNRSLPKAFRLIEAWGFRYITCLTWVKPSIGMGNYFRGSTEQVLFAVKGTQPLKRRDVGTHFEARRGEGHSAKPDEFYSLVESCSYGPYIDIFGRKERDGWIVWGENS